jgi:hypothetical protein
LGNSERQLYTNENHKSARKPCITKRVNIPHLNHDQREKEFQYGYFEAKAKLPVEWYIIASIGSQHIAGWSKCID